MSAGLRLKHIQTSGFPTDGDPGEFQHTDNCVLLLRLNRRYTSLELSGQDTCQGIWRLDFRAGFIMYGYSSPSAQRKGRIWGKHTFDEIRSIIIGLPHLCHDRLMLCVDIDPYRFLSSAQLQKNTVTGAMSFSVTRLRVKSTYSSVFSCSSTLREGSCNLADN